MKTSTVKLLVVFLISTATNIQDPGTVTESMFLSLQKLLISPNTMDLKPG